jgi:DNA polymerase III epsilon subunit-like protein/ADP-ribose pyrophosphatase YjhB (NUDIX family)
MEHWGQVAVFDLETTGIDVEKARIVSACIAVIADDGAVIERWDWLADPGIEIPEGASAIHGITTERARAEGRLASEVVAEITQTLRVLFALGIPLVVYNAPYDLTLLDRESRRHRVVPLQRFSPVIDPLVIDKALDRYRKGKRTLEVTAALYSVVLDDAHDAGADAIAAGRVAQALGRTFPDDLDITLADLHARQELWFADQAAHFQEYIRTVKGDADYVADGTWPLRPLDDVTAFVDTQPIPAPPPRPSLTVPFFDLYGTGVLALEPTRHEPVVVEPVVVEPVSSEPVSSEELTITTIEEMIILEDARERQREAAPTPSDSVSEQSDSVSEQLGAVSTLAPPLDSDEFDEGDTVPVFGVPQQTDAPSVASQVEQPPSPVAGPRPTILRVAAGIVTDPAGRTLLVRKRGTSAFMQAGGKIEAGESALEALARELREEIGLELDPDHTEYLGSFRAVAANEPDTVVRAEVFALVTSVVVSPQGEIEELLWLEGEVPDGIELAALSRDTILPLWETRRSTLF